MSCKINSNCQFSTFHVKIYLKIWYSFKKRRKWTLENGLEHCKKRGIYLLWNITLTNITSACKNFIHVDQRWIGVVKDLYLSKDNGNLYLFKTWIENTLLQVFVCLSMLQPFLIFFLIILKGLIYTASKNKWEYDRSEYMYAFTKVQFYGNEGITTN